MKHVFALLLLIATLLVSCTPAQENTPTTTADRTPQGPTLTLTIDGKGYIPLDTITGIPWEKGLRVGEVVKRLKDQIQFNIKDYAGLGRMVTGINGLENNTHEGHYWQFCVAGTFSEVGMDDKILESGQDISWYYRAYGESPCKQIGE